MVALLAMAANHAANNSNVANISVIGFAMMDHVLMFVLNHAWWQNHVDIAVVLHVTRVLVPMSHAQLASLSFASVVGDKQRLHAPTTAFQSCQHHFLLHKWQTSEPVTLSIWLNLLRKVGN